MQGEIHTGTIITDLTKLVEKAEANAGCYGCGEPSADDPAVEDSYDVPEVQPSR